MSQSNQYFSLFRLKPEFDIHLSELEQAYHTLVAQFHPDKFAAASTFEQKQAAVTTAAINDAYHTLKNPTERAAYLLKQYGINADAPEHTAFASEFLMQQMQWREALEEALLEKNEAALTLLDRTISTEQHNIQQQMSMAFTKQDYQTAAEQVRKSRFLNKLRQEIQAALP